MHDYFTSCLPFAQKGDAVTLPLSSTLVELTNTTGRQFVVEDDLSGIVPPAVPDDPLDVDASSGIQVANTNAWIDPNGTLEVQAETSTIETLRQAFRLQEWLELNARGGTRYTEHLSAHFDVKAQDSRLQRPEYIGGTTGNMVISEVLNTTGDPQGQQTAAVGDLHGHGIGVNQGKTFKYNAKEHGWIIGVMSVTPTTAYQQGLPRSHDRLTHLDYAFPTFANLGEQEVFNKEIYFENELPGPETLDGIFGYIPRYAEYKYVNSRVAGDFKTTLDFWHLGSIFGSAPALNDQFIKYDIAELKRIFAVEDPDVHSVLGHIFNNVSVTRKLPKYGIPTI